jgi:hypothetical protein
LAREAVHLKGGQSPEDELALLISDAGEPLVQASWASKQINNWKHMNPLVSLTEGYQVPVTIESDLIHDG